VPVALAPGPKEAGLNSRLIFCLRKVI
jgi:hypothetical protein